MYKIYEYHFFIISILFSFTLNAQNSIDSLQNKSYDELQNIYNQHIKADTGKAKTAMKAYINQAKRKKDTLEIAKGFELYSVFISDSGKIKYLDSIIAITKNKQNRDYPASAYYYKAQYFLLEERNIKKTLANLNLARNYAKLNNNINLLNRIDYYVGIVRSEHLNEKEKAIEIFKKCAQFYSSKTDDHFNYRYLYTIHSIAETFIGLKKYDSATYYNNLGYSISSNNKNPNIVPMKAYFTLCEGINQYTRKKYPSAIDSINTALSSIIEFEDKSNILDSYFYLGKSYFDLGKSSKAVDYFIKTDSILETLNSIPQYKHVKTYEYLKDHYKIKNDLKNQNKYLDKLNSVLSNYLNDHIFISKKVKEDYDIPILLEEQQILLKKIEKNKTSYISGMIFMTLLLLILGGVLYYQYRKKRLYRLRFERLIAEPISTSQSTNISKKKPVSEEQDIKVPEKHVTYILEKLDEFEKNQGFLTLGMSSQSLADDIKTNIKYLSQVVNYYKNKSFTNYLNELRIDYAVKELKENVMLRKFTIKAIANEFGYNSAETFSNAFYKQVKIKPSYYIRELRKTDSNKKKIR